MIHWVYKTWIYFWRTVMVLLGIILVVAGGTFGLLQLSQTQEYIADQIEDEFNRKFRGELQIDKLEGLLPFHFQFSGVTISASSSPDTLQSYPIKVDTLSAKLDWSGLFRRSLIIDQLNIKSPEVRLVANDSAGFTIESAFEERSAAFEQPGQNVFSHIKVMAPYLNVRNGQVRVDRLKNNKLKGWNLPEPLVAESIDLSLYVEIDDRKRFLDIEHFSAHLPSLSLQSISSSGQIFSEDSLLEFNGFEVKTRRSLLQLTGKVEGFDLWKGKYLSQFRNARYNMNVDSALLNLKEWGTIRSSSKLPVVEENIGLKGSIRGDQDTLELRELVLFKNGSTVAARGTIRNLFDPEYVYQLSLDTLSIYRRDIQSFARADDPWAKGEWRHIKGNGSIAGSSDTVQTQFRLASNYGKITGSLKTSLNVPYDYKGNVKVDSLNLEGWGVAGRLPRSNLNAEISGAGLGIQWNKAVSNLEGRITDSRIRQIPLRDLRFQVDYLEGFIEPSFTLNNPEDEFFEGKGWIDLSRTPRKIQFSGSARNLNLRHFTADTLWPSTNLKLNYNIDLTGQSLSTLYGHVSLDVAPSIINGDTVEAHTFYADLDEPNSENRLLRLTSSLMDFELSGDIAPGPILAMYKHWKPYLYQKLRYNMMLDSTNRVPDRSVSPASLQAIDLTADIALKQVELINHYFENVPSLKGGTRINAQIKAEAQKMLIRGDFRDRQLQIGALQLNQPSVQFTGNFNYDRSRDDLGSLNMEAAFEELTYNKTNLRDYQADLQLLNDSIRYEHRVNQPEGDVVFELTTSMNIADTAVVAQIDHFIVGNQQYAWTKAENNPRVTYTRSGKLHFDQFRFQSQQEQVHIEGILSSELNDAVYYHLQNIKLRRVSELLGGRLQFNGTLNGDFYTSSLTSQPAIEGKIQVKEFMLNDRLVGDVAFESKYSPKDKLFNTQINIQTDTSRYADYLKQNEGIGQDIKVEGYLQPPDLGDTRDHLFKFNVDFREIDMWIIREIVPNILDDVEGRATGKGWIAGNAESYDFHSEFDVYDVFVNTKFLNTNYQLNGPVEFDKNEGLIFHEVQLTDRQGGGGELTGRVDLNDFQPVKYFDLTLSMNRLQFLNKRMDEDVPFFGRMYGSGQLHLSGTNENPFLRTTQTVNVAEESSLSIPLLDETELNEDSRFIQFVDEFEDGNIKTNGQEQNGEQENGDDEDRTFTEIFRLDLQFEANQNMTVKLIFDPVTGDVLTAEGTGQLNIRLEDDEVSMFGTYNIDRGSYQFVSGDIFTRNFQLESGGRISWKGDPANAELDVTAVYNERPSVSSLMGSRSDQNREQRNIQNIPVDLVLHITGTLSAINNEFYFRLPNTMDISQNVAIANRISQLNRDDEQKLLQATSLLLTGEFIPVASDGTNAAQPYFGDNLSGSSLVLNPLLSNQVFSPLLSNQINSILNSDISSLDVDINLNAYNQVDLGIALRLYNNRLVLRREGQVTGPQSNLGNLGATYRISRSLSVKAFHRQDLTLTTVTNAQTQVEYLNGAGIEARVQFNSWQDLTRRFFNSIKRLFTGKSKAVREKNEEQDDLAEVEE